MNKHIKLYSNITKFRNTKHFYFLLLDITLSFFHPNVVFYYLKTKIGFTETWYMINIEYEVNDILLVITLLRVYIVCRFLLVLSEYYSSRAERIVKIFGKRLSKLFVMRCLLLIKPLQTILILALISIIILSCMIKIIEGINYFTRDYSQAVDFSLFVNSIWATTVTMTAVGYGDLPPSTLFGRVIMILASLIGTILISLMMMSLQNYLKLNDNEVKAFKEYNISNIRENMRIHSAKFFFSSYRYLNLKSKYYRAIKNDLISIDELSELREEVIKAMSKKLENKKAFNTFIK